MPDTASRELREALLEASEHECWDGDNFIARPLTHLAAIAQPDTASPDVRGIRYEPILTDAEADAALAPTPPDAPKRMTYDEWSAAESARWEEQMKAAVLSLPEMVGEPNAGGRSLVRRTEVIEALDAAALAPTPPDALIQRNGDLRDALLAARRVFQEHMIRLGRYTGNTHIQTFAREAIADIDAALDAPCVLAPTPDPASLDSHGIIDLGRQSDTEGGPS